MATLNDFKKYLNHEFSSGPYTGKDYRTFQNKYINYLRSLCKQNSWELVSIGRNHYCFTAFIKNTQNKYAYLSISDVRFWPGQWYKLILIRTAAHEKNYTGGINRYTSLPDLQDSLTKLFKYGD